MENKFIWVFFDEDRFEDAIKARKVAEEKYFKEYNINYDGGEDFEG